MSLLTRNRLVTPISRSPIINYLPVVGTNTLAKPVVSLLESDTVGAPTLVWLLRNLSLVRVEPYLRTVLNFRYCSNEFSLLVGGDTRQSTCIPQVKPLVNWLWREVSVDYFMLISFWNLFDRVLQVPLSRSYSSDSLTLFSIVTGMLPEN